MMRKRTPGIGRKLQISGGTTAPPGLYMWRRAGTLPVIEQTIMKIYKDLRRIRDTMEN